MNPQVLGAATVLAQKAQQAHQVALQAQQMAANNAKAIAQLQEQLSAASGTPSGVWTPILTTPTTSLVYLGNATAWFTLPLQRYVPADAKWVLLSGYAYFSTPDNANVELDFRRDSADTSIRCACRYRSVNGSYSGNAAINIMVPISASCSIDYQVINGSFGVLIVNPVAYL